MPIQRPKGKQKNPFCLQDLITRELQQIPGVRVKSPDGAFYIFPEVSDLFGQGIEAQGFGPVPDVDALCRSVANSCWFCSEHRQSAADCSADLLCRYLLQEAQVAVVPGDAFGKADCLRISYAASQQQLEEAMRRVQAALAPDKLPRRREQL